MGTSKRIEAAAFVGGRLPALLEETLEKLFALPCDTLVYPAHDYQHRHVSTVAQERDRNPRLGGGKTLDQFVELMARLDLPYPKRIDIAVPANRVCGGCPQEEVTIAAEPPGPAFQG